MMQRIVDGLYESSPSKILYHYTSLQGLLSIVSSRVLWASEAHYLNDAAELRHFGQRLDTEILQRLEGGHPLSLVLQQLRNWLPNRLNDGPMIFLGSFTENGNLLSQWRGYCQIGKGVSLGFEHIDLVSTARRASFSVGKCIYDGAAQAKTASQVIEAILEMATRSGPSTTKHPTQSFYETFESLEPELLRIAVLMKSATFHEEYEWRFVSPILSNYVEPDIKYREGVATLIPYLEMPLPVTVADGFEVLALSHVVIGPTPNANLSISAISRYLSRAGVRGKRVSNSCVPYRNV